MLEDVATESKARALERCPVIQTRFVLLQLMKSLRICMTNTQTLTCMELEGLPLSCNYLQELIEVSLKFQLSDTGHLLTGCTIEREKSYCGPGFDLRS